ncbi:unnamed protein product [Effrenium voratum]|uniref:CENP-V/GFA domain-containing protein n=1 Tax=Effrenium voratum TaxID=2562239 RepID=A0AA36NLC8_9DINO|nr:unnamed protein product [Effrenium voratum]
MAVRAWRPMPPPQPQLAVLDVRRHGAGLRERPYFLNHQGLAPRAGRGLAVFAVRRAQALAPEDEFDDEVFEEEDEEDDEEEDDENYEGPWQHALSLLQAMQTRRLQLGEINVGSAVQACLAVRTTKSPMSSRWQQALMLFRTASTKRVLPDPACCGLLIAECEQRGLQTVEQDIISRLRDPSAVKDDILVTATAVANDIAARARKAALKTRISFEKSAQSCGIEALDALRWMLGQLPARKDARILATEPGRLPEEVDALAADLAKVHLGDEESTANADSTALTGSCKCNGCRFRFPLAKVLPHGRLDMSNCHCPHCRRAHSAAFASYVTVQTAAIERLKGGDLVVARSDHCEHLAADVLRIFCGRCFSSLAMLPKVGEVVHVAAGCLEVENFPKVESFIPWCAEKAPPYLGFVPAGKKQRQKAKQTARQGPVTGGCSCGQCQFTLPRFPAELQHCYCGSCRKLSGAAWQTWMPVEGQLQWTRKDTLKLVRTTNHAKRHVCTNCGVFMTIVYDEDGAVWPLAGALDDCYTKEDLALQVSDVSHICVKYKQPWWVLPADGLSRIKGPS